MSQTVVTRLLFTHADRHRLEQVVDVLVAEAWELSERGGEYTYQSDGPKRADTVEEVLTDVERSESASVGLERDGTTVNVSYDPATKTNRHTPLTSIRVWSWSSAFTASRDGWNGRSRDEPTRAYVDVVATAVSELSPDYGYGKYPDEVPPGHVPTYDDVLDGRVRTAFWLNVFAPRSIRSIGRERIIAAPAWLAREVGDDHLLVVTTDNPVRPSDEWSEGTDALGDHLGIRS